MFYDVLWLRAGRRAFVCFFVGAFMCMLQYIYIYAFLRNNNEVGIIRCDKHNHQRLRKRQCVAKRNISENITMYIRLAESKDVNY